MTNETIGKKKSFSKKFYEKWYSITNDLQQVIVLPEFSKKPLVIKRIERMPGKIREESSLDEMVSALQTYNKPYHLILSRKKIQGSSKEELDPETVMQFMYDWCGLFDRHIEMTIDFVFSTPKNPRGTKKIRKITARITRKSM